MKANKVTRGSMVEDWNVLKAVSDLKPEPGQIWMENDPRFQRYVKVTQKTTSSWIGIRTVEWTGGEWNYAKGSRHSYARPERFNGKRGNYVYVESNGTTCTSS